MTSAEHLRIPVQGLAGEGPLTFALFVDLGTARRQYAAVGEVLSATRQQSLVEADVEELWIRTEDRDAWLARIASELDSVVLDRSLALDWRIDMFVAVAAVVHADLFVAQPALCTVERAAALMADLVEWLDAEPEAYPVLRERLVPGRADVGHALAVALLAVRLAVTLTSSSTDEIEALGLAAFAHDIGSAAGGPMDTSPEHSRVGERRLLELGVAPLVAELVLLHHERYDGSGFPHGLRGEAIPFLAQILGMADAFDRIYSMQGVRIGIYDSLRILAQAYAGCFAPRLEAAFFGLFRDDA